MFTAIAISLFLGLGLVMAVIHAETIKETWEKMIASAIYIFSPKGVVELAKEFYDEPNMVKWAGETHYHAGTGMTSALILCVLHRDGGPQDPIPTRWQKLNAVEFFSEEEPTCRLCKEVEQDLAEARMIDEDPSHGCLP